MDKSSDQLGVNPLSRVNSLSTVASIGSPAQSLESRASNLANQQAALAAQMAMSSGALQKMMSTADVSAAARLINQSLKQAEAEGVLGKYLAQTVVTQNPTLPNIVSQQLKTAISQSGLFYESHLNDFIDGRLTLTDIKQEPQNKSAHLMQALLPQQLHILEHQRLSWHGEIWPHQRMDWDIYVQNHQENKEGNAYPTQDEPAAMASDLTLHLPRLGKISAKISLKDGRMRIDFLAEQEKALQLLKEKSPVLTQAIESGGQKLESITLNRAMEIKHEQ